MITRKIRIATRKSPLAMWQAQHVADQLMHEWANLQVELVPMMTSGDVFMKKGGGKGLFVKELEEALLQNRADLAVHSMKDVPADCPGGLLLAAICERDNPYDALVSDKYPTLASLPLGATIGTSSLRRQSQLLAYRPDLTMVTLRGNVQTRINKLQNQPYDAIILAAAGLRRLNMQNHIQQIISQEIMLPACGQGAIGLECRLDDHLIHELIAPLNHAQTAMCVQSERHINRLLGGSCEIPVAIYSQLVDDNQVHIQAKVASANGKHVITDTQIGAQMEIMQLAQDCAQSLFRKGAMELLKTDSH